jgi:hypothetical protein
VGGGRAGGGGDRAEAEHFTPSSTCIASRCHRHKRRGRRACSRAPPTLCPRRGCRHRAQAAARRARRRRAKAAARRAR